MHPCHAHLLVTSCASTTCADDDGLDPVRQRTQQYSQRVGQEKVMLQLRKFKEQEAMYLKLFAAAEKKGTMHTPARRSECLQPSEASRLSLPAHLLFVWTVWQI